MWRRNESAPFEVVTPEFKYNLLSRPSRPLKTHALHGITRKRINIPRPEPKGHVMIVTGHRAAKSTVRHLSRAALKLKNCKAYVNGL
jgi:hypothetical protein